MLKLILATLVIVAICVILLCVKIILLPNGRFSNTHVGASKEMRKRGIKCVQAQDADARDHSLKKF